MIRPQQGYLGIHLIPAHTLPLYTHFENHSACITVSDKEVSRWRLIDTFIPIPASFLL